MTDYIPAKDAALKWNISERRVQILCEHERVDGAFRLGNTWAIPADATKPKDARKREIEVQDLCSKKKSITTIDAPTIKRIVDIIERARVNAFRAVNRELISMYWEIGRQVSEMVASGKGGKSTVRDFSRHIQSHFEGIRGFSPQNIWRMKQFFETYDGKKRLSPLVREVSWTNNVLIMMAAKTDEEREFYLILTSKNNYSKRELERQIDSSLYERMMISDEKNQSIITRSAGLMVLRDSYVFEFLNVPEHHKEKELRRAIVANMRDFILEFGKDFTFIGEEFTLQVGNTDFSIDLLFYNRELSCLVAIELKIGRFKPEHLGQLEFYLEALDRDVKKQNENPSVGLILCAKKDDEVVEYALSRSMSPALIAEYQTHLPQKALLREKLRELREIAESGDFEDEDSIETDE
jgi:predicted nuclease of restriction endonuclease-like (RecB) superfamily